MNHGASHRRGLARWSTAITLALCLVGCVPVQTTPEPTDEPSRQPLDRVILLDISGLEPAAVGKQKIYKPGPGEHVDPSNPDAGSARGFFLQVATARPDELDVWINDSTRGVSSDLVRVSGPVLDPEVLDAAKPRPYNDNIRAHLRSGAGVYWVTEAVDATQPYANDVAVLLPDQMLSPFSTLRLATSYVGDIPVNTVDIELVNDFYYVAVIGDSIQWGNGLLEQDKMSTLVARQIETDLDQRVIVQRLAQNGAHIVPTEWDNVCPAGCYGEVPTTLTSVTTQLHALENPESVDLLLVDGCINDVGITVILDPFVSVEDLSDRTTEFCGQEMTQLLRQAEELLPNATIVVTGYYPIVSLESDPFGIQQLAALQGIQPNTVAEEIVDELTVNADVFSSTANNAIAAAVQTVGEEAETDRLLFADPGFRPRNAIFASDAWLWGMTAENNLIEFINLGLEVFPEDPIAELRMTVCATRYGTDDLLLCTYGSVGHPNAAGAAAYAQSVVTELRTAGILPE